MSAAELQYVNVYGSAVDTRPKPPKAKKREQPESFHKGWRVLGIPPGALEAAREGNRRLAEMAEKAGGARRSLHSMRRTG